MECKSGYGLTVGDEARSLVVAKQVTDETTFLGAHVVPQEFKDSPDDYVDLICGPMLDAVLPNSKWIDVFCDKGAFTTEQARKILKAGMEKGLRPRLHANQLEPGDGIMLGVELGAASVDHLSYFDDEDIEALASSSTVATLLPAAEFSTRADYPDARRLHGAAVLVALASDCNPGTSYTTNMPFVIALAVRDLHFSPEQAIWSATKGGALALQRTDVGHLGVGAKADFSILNTSSYIHLAYRPGVPLIDEVWRNGTRIK
jgi:imidazolonepropionase